MLISIFKIIAYHIIHNNQIIHYTMIQIRKYSSLILLSSTLFTLSCSGQKYVPLNNSRFATKVPNKSSMYKNIDRFDTKLLVIIDTEVIYEEFDIYKNILERLDYVDVRNSYAVIRFYPNGYFNTFYFRREEAFNVNSFAPLLDGYRGIYYLGKNNEIKNEIFAPTRGTGRPYGRIEGEFEVHGDTIISYQRKDNRYPDIYIKREVPKEYLDYQVDWKGDLEKQRK